MANTIVQPTAEVVTLDLAENTEFYVCPSAEALTSDDLLPNTTGDIDADPERSITRVQLHNDLDYVTPGTDSSRPFTIRAVLADSNAKLQELKAARKNASTVKFNAFFRDGSGLSGYAYVTRIKSSTDNTEWYKDITFEPYGVVEIDAP